MTAPSDPLPGAVAESATRPLSAPAMEELLQRIAHGEQPGGGRDGTQYLLFRCGQTPCAVALTDLREVLPVLPAAVAMPFSPPWLLGLFPLRAELLGLVDPAPLLLSPTGQAAYEASALAMALVAEDDGVALGLAVAAVGAIALVPPEEVVPITPAAVSAVAPTYAQGIYVSPRGGTPYTVVDLRRLVADLLARLREDAADE
ncbi:MAG TPA: chemotaxis protein CheW [Ktedonobacterales bacterium]